MSPSARHANIARREPDEIILPGRVAAAFEALDRAQVSWCLLRDGDPSDPNGDVDVLIPKGDIERARRALVTIEYRERRAFGYEPHRFFVTVDAGGVTKLDVVDDLRFGPSGYRPGRLEGAAQRRVRSGGLWRLAPADEFWALLFHAALDKPAIAERHRVRLRELLQIAGEQREADRAVIDGVAAGRWEDVAARIRALAGGPSAFAGASRRARMRIGWRLRALGTPGVTAALMGPDGAGKSTLAKLLAERFPIPVRTIYMGLYKKRRRTPPGVGLAARLVLQWSRFARASYHRSRGRVVLFDRFTDDATLGAPSGSRDRLRRRLLAAAVPRPDVVLVLDAPAADLLARKGEHDLDRLERARLHYRGAAERARRGAILDATRPADVVAGEAAAILWNALTERS